MRHKELFKFIRSRHIVWQKKERGQPKPWTKDVIIQQNKFCNVYRELDTQTKWFANNWRNDHEDLWFASLVFRVVNWGPSAEAIGYPVPWNPTKFVNALRTRKAEGEKLYSSAYMISTHGKREEKAPYLAKSLSMIWKQRDKIRYQKGETLDTFHSRLMDCFDVGSFIAAQVIADCKYAGDMRRAPDWWTFAASGPGSKRGLNRVFDFELNNPWNEEVWRDYLTDLKSQIDPLVKKMDMDPLHAQDLQNCLCEFDKYERVRLGQGRCKSRYPGAKE